MDLKDLTNNYPDWEMVQLFGEPFKIHGPEEWCHKKLIYGKEYVLHISELAPKYNTDWGTFDLDNYNVRVFTYLFKNAKHATMFRLRWSSLIKES